MGVIDGVLDLRVCFNEGFHAIAQREMLYECAAKGFQTLLARRRNQDLEDGSEPSFHEVLDALYHYCDA